MLRHKTSFVVWRYRFMLWMLSPLIWGILRLRLNKGKEDPARWKEKLGYSNIKRPVGKLIWIHGVGLGESLSARPIITALKQRDQTLQFLVTSSTKSSADVLTHQLPKNVIHQFMPVDTPMACNRFLDHWTPDTSIWIEQDIWPGMVLASADRNIPLALVNGRMMDIAAKKRAKAIKLYKETYRAFDLITAQDDTSAKNLETFCNFNIPTVPNLKSVAPALKFCTESQHFWGAALAKKQFWVVGSAHFADIEIALEAHENLLKINPDATLVILPRYLDQIPQIEELIASKNIISTRTDDKNITSVIIETAFGKSGLWYSIADAALIGGGFDDTGGHSPWEAVHLNCGVIYGPNTKHFAQDYQTLNTAQAAIQVNDAKTLSKALTQTDFTALCAHATSVVDHKKNELSPFFDRIVEMVKSP